MESAIRFLDEQFGLTNPRFGSVYGLRQSRAVDNWEFDRVTAARVFIIRINDAEGQQSSRDYPRTLDGASQTYEDGGGRCTLRASSL
ncbi:hypothetical protein [Streptomyces anulatus]|uniref:hypothetical protein n=1 Tax=Streptomyces anulatus TaxID=1892 RepID=UPI003412C589